ncbi:3'(2'),5'-bisphosphate nucleotidase CysQ [Ramlibacter sp.]|uniref:3'(2'),5'-bisphosphate nucleotidase CysQ n=1 Tax=Ramlibacter sp. TaxID=1917967 RepID=UPI00185BDAA4|nr:3'(2'),5'-bisphosphate nucleotidase CysQ [Ramlibacter sp.]MBA2675530.1 3'(2'),5'-bisphosphate nucleotidase CysQ [Ramlibacter sp.]
MQPIRHANLLEQVIPLAREAGKLIMAIYAEDFAVTHKADASPVTQADAVAEAAIVQGLRALAPMIPIVAEEAVSAGEKVSAGERFWLVDPLDGTKEFISRNGEFTVNIALIEHGEPVLGVVYAPALDCLYAGARDLGAFRIGAGGLREPIACRPPGLDGLVVVASRSHGDEAALETFLAGRKVARVAQAGSSLKLCLLAEGAADVYPRLGRTMEWDIAAGHAVLAAAGGRVCDLQGKPLGYGKPGFDNPHFAAWAARA